MPTRGQLVRCLTTGELLTSWCIVVVCQTVGALHGVDLVQGENAQKGAALKKKTGGMLHDCLYTKRDFVALIVRAAPVWKRPCTRAL